MKVNFLTITLAVILAIVLFGSGFFIGKSRAPFSEKEFTSMFVDSIKNAVHEEFKILRSATVDRQDTVFKYGTKIVPQIEYILIPSDSSDLNTYTSRYNTEVLSIDDTLLIEGYLRDHKREIKIDTPYIFVTTTLRDTVEIESKPTVITEYVSKPALVIGASIGHYNASLATNIYTPQFDFNVQLGYMDRKRQQFTISKSLIDKYGFAIGYGYKLW